MLYEPVSVSNTFNAPPHRRNEEVDSSDWRSACCRGKLGRDPHAPTYIRCREGGDRTRRGTRQADLQPCDSLFNRRCRHSLVTSIPNQNKASLSRVCSTELLQGCDKAAHRCRIAFIAGYSEPTKAHNCTNKEKAEKSYILIMY